MVSNCLYFYWYDVVDLGEIEAFEPKWVNSILYIIGVNSLRLGGLQIIIKNQYWSIVIVTKKSY